MKSLKGGALSGGDSRSSNRPGQSLFFFEKLEISFVKKPFFLGHKNSRVGKREFLGKKLDLFFRMNILGNIQL